MIIFRRSGETLADRQGNTDDGTINRVQHYSNRISQMKLAHILYLQKKIVISAANILVIWDCV